MSESAEPITFVIDDRQVIVVDYAFSWLADAVSLRPDRDILTLADRDMVGVACGWPDHDDERAELFIVPTDKA